MPNNIRIQPLYLPNGGDPAQFNESSLMEPGMLGGRTTIVDPNDTTRSKTFQLVKSDSTMSVAPYNGAVAWWSNQAEYLVTTAATNRGQVAGVFLAAITPGNYCCIQTAGRHASVKFIDAVTATPDASGKFVIPSATAAKADCLAAGTAATYPALGRSAGTYDAVNATGPVDLEVPEVT